MRTTTQHHTLCRTCGVNDGNSVACRGVAQARLVAAPHNAVVCLPHDKSLGVGDVDSVVHGLCLRFHSLIRDKPVLQKQRNSHRVIRGWGGGGTEGEGQGQGNNAPNLNVMHAPHMSGTGGGGRIWCTNSEPCELEEGP